MSTAVASPTLDVSGTQRVPLSRIVKVELRKLADTRAGIWLLIAVGGIAVLVIAGFFIWGRSDQRTFLDLVSYAGIPFSFMLPVLGILLITQEWGQRTALVTFTQVPHRGKVLAAKVIAALIFTMGAMLVAYVVAAPLSLVGGSDHPFHDVTIGLLAKIFLGLVIGTMWGLAFGAAFLNSAFAIVLYFVVPTIISVAGGIWTAAQDKLLWFDLNASTSKLYDSAASMGGKEWAEILTGFLVWIALPAAFGTWRILRSEVK
jgi:ABC-2 type transport system permease protein